MGISTHYYTVYGIKHDGYDEDLNEHSYERKFPIIVDAMGGEYYIVGKILFDSGDLRWGETKDDFVDIPFNILDQIREDYTKEFQAVLPEYMHLLEGEWKLMTFVHYS